MVGVTARATAGHTAPAVRKQRDDCWCLAPFLLCLRLRTTACGTLLSTFRAGHAVFSIKPLWESLLDNPRVVSLGDSRPSQADKGG